MLANFTADQVALLRDAVMRHIEDEESRIFPLADRLDEAATTRLSRLMDEYERGREPRADPREEERATRPG